jgi:hypothetical protein
MIMKNIITILFIALPIGVFGQSIDRQVVAAGGDYFEAASTNISWTLGELVTGNLDNGDLYFTQGFHQGNLMVTFVGEKPIAFALKAYPNPVVNVLIIESEKLDLSYRLIDVQGNILENGIISSTSHELDLSPLPSGIYFLWVEENQTHKIIKK